MLQVAMRIPIIELNDEDVSSSMNARHDVLVQTSYERGKVIIEINGQRATVKVADIILACENLKHSA